MDVSDLLNSLNDKQRQAVAAPNGNFLVLAGAGSGKTRVLVHRIAWQMLVENCTPYSVMAVTFTNKAAAEMRHRIASLVGTSQQGMWIGTFHGLANRLLRIHHQDANLQKDFHILDNEDQLRLLKRLIRAMNLDEKSYPARQAMWYIGCRKDEGLRPQDVENYGNSIEMTWQSIYQAYQTACDRASLVDFAELLLRAHELWVNKPHILQHYRARFTNILVDEFQDANKIQYAWIRMLAGNEGNVMIVGDDDQSIYGWRGAHVENIQRFLDDFPGAKTIRLEQNYRSSSNILQAANALIKHNDGRLGKNLWTEGAEGEPIMLYCAFNELDEARFVANRIKESLNKGGFLKDYAILYRSNSQSRVLEEALLQMGIPYRVYGGMRFFERQEIKDALAYLRLIANRNDDTAYERVVNTPTRGLGDRTLDVVRQIARQRQITLWESSRALLSEHALAGRAAALQRFLDLIDALEKETEALPLHVQTARVINHVGLRRLYEQEKGGKGQGRIENLEELISATRQFIDNDKEQNLLPLQAFLSYAALEAGERQDEVSQDTVQLMTLHAAKGLEFPQVFIVGMEEGMFPSQMSLDEVGRLEEERRLAYVGVTRAMKTLTITYAETRRLYGKEVYHRPSRFVRELPIACVEEVRLRANVTRAPSHHRYMGARVSENDSAFRIGQRVRHPKFGEGKVINLEGSGMQSRLQIAFQSQGIKWLVAAYARLETV